MEIVSTERRVTGGRLGRSWCANVGDAFVLGHRRPEVVIETVVRREVLVRAQVPLAAPQNASENEQTYRGETAGGKERQKNSTPVRRSCTENHKQFPSQRARKHK